MYKLYTFYRSSTAWRARIALNLKNIKPEYIYVHLFKGQQRSTEYQKINPNTGVPTLVLPSGEQIFQSMAIIQYLNQTHPSPYNLFPGNALNRAHIRAFCQVINSGIHPYQNLKLVQKVYKDFGCDKKQWTVQWMIKGLNTIQKMLQKNQINNSISNRNGNNKQNNYENNKQNKYCFGNQITAADVFFYPQIMASKYRWGIDIEKYQRINRLLKTLENVKEFRDANPQNQPDYQK